MQCKQPTSLDLSVMATCAGSAPQGGAGSRGISSSVMLKKAQPLMPRFSQLQANVDLNLPPPNWLRAGSPATLFPRAHLATPPITDNEPSSTALASHYPEVVGEVDVISDSQNIKKLLKIPYCMSPLSMAIHRVGETLLIDEFAAPINLHSGVSASLDKLFEDSKLQLWFNARKKHPALTRHRNMFSKLLYYSLADRALLPATEAVPSDSSQSREPTPVVDEGSKVREEEADPSGFSGESGLIPSDRINKKTGSTGCRDQGGQQVETATMVSGDDEAQRIHATVCEAQSVGGRLVADGGGGSDDGACEDKQLLPTCTSVKMVERGNGELERREEGKKEEVVNYDAWGEETGGVKEGAHEKEGEVTFPYSPPLPASQLFHHDVQWGIADIRMLLGSDLPIFGRGSHPAISLRLRDMEKPITVLTGLDYWLDNLMCNVPELAMCFHLDGIVQRYETVKTEDIPNLEDSQFSPQEVLEVAQNILAFLKANCTREGHTYWLFRRRGEEVVKLYDITSLMETSAEEEERGKMQNPFARSVAVLFYRVARNMLINSGAGGLFLSGEELTMAKLLLENCIRLLRDSHSDRVNISSSACYLLADLYLNQAPRSYPMSHDQSSDVDVGSYDQSDGGNAGSHDQSATIHTGSCDRKSPGERGSEEGKASSTSLSSLDSKFLSVSALRQGPQTFPDDPAHPLPPLVLGGSQDRARLALESIAKGLSILGDSLFGSPPSPEVPPAHTCGGHLLQKAGSAYLTLSQSFTKMNKFGRALRYARYAVLCFCSSKHLVSAPTAQVQVDHFLSWQQCGDLHCLSSKMSSSLDSDLEDFRLENPEDTPIIAVATRLHPPESGSKEEVCLTMHTNRETSLWRSIDCYETALQLVASVPPLETASSYLQKTLRTHFGSAWNELGTHYMVVSSSLDYAQDKEKVEKLWMCSYSCLNRGLDLFDASDGATAPNRAITYANMGCLARACASVHTRLAEATGAEFSSDEKTYYDKSLEYYTTAQQVLKRQSSDPGFWSSLTYDLGLVHNAVAKHMLERPPLSKLSQSEVERKAVDSLIKSLHCLEPQLSVVDRDTQRFKLISQLAGDCHYRLGSLYHKTAFSRSSSAQKVKHSRSQSEKHYSKAQLFYLPEHHSKEILRLFLEKSTLFELQAQQGQAVRHQVKWLENALSCLLLCESTLQHYQSQQDKTKETSGEDGEEGSKQSHGESREDVDRESRGRESRGGQSEEDEDEEEECDPLISLLLRRLLGVLKQLVASAMKKSDSLSKSLASYKSMYAVALRASQSTASSLSAQLEQARHCLKTTASLWRGD